MENAARLPLPDLAAALLANAPHVELPFDYEYDTWVLAKDSMRFLLALVRQMQPRTIIEFGSGTSTQIVSRELAADAVFRSFDHVESYAARTRQSLPAGAGACAVEVRFRPLRFRFFHGKLLPFYGLGAGDLGDAFRADLVIVDGPPGSWGREAALYAAFPAMAPGAILMLDDAARPGEQRALAAWRHYFGNAVEFASLAQLGKGILLARKRSERPQGRPFPFADRLGALCDAARTAWRHRPPWMRRTRRRS